MSELVLSDEVTREQGKSIAELQRELRSGETSEVIASATSGAVGILALTSKRLLFVWKHGGEIKKLELPRDTISDFTV